MKVEWNFPSLLEQVNEMQGILVAAINKLKK
jgi:hypothetical protein